MSHIIITIIGIQILCKILPASLTDADQLREKKLSHGHA